jgi:hypothetical protein
VFFLGKPFQPSLMSCLTDPTQVKHRSGAPIQGKLLALPTIIRLGWKGLRETLLLCLSGALIDIFYSSTNQQILDQAGESSKPLWCGLMFVGKARTLPGNICQGKML